jgi:oligopeptidase B
VGQPAGRPRGVRVLKSYTPYENVSAVEYPLILAVTSRNDRRVLYHEPAKWLAKLRAVAPDGSYLLMTKTRPVPAAPSGRYDARKEDAFINAGSSPRLGRAGVTPAS